MATPLRKSVAREAMSTDRKGRKLIVTLEPGDVLTFRSKGKRRVLSVYLGHCYVLAQILTLEHEYKKAMEAYNAKKKAGMRFVRKPSRPSAPFSRIYLDALR